jgi:hypothetical protein
MQQPHHDTRAEPAVQLDTDVDADPRGYGRPVDR